MACESDLLRIKSRFNDYVSTFYTGVPAYDPAIRIKETHTRNVALEILQLADSLNANAEQCYMAEIVAILHDIGRFEQFAKYGTYRDNVSENHATMGVHVIDEIGIIEGLSDEDRNLIVFVVEHHNRAMLPERGDERSLFLLKLLRDADKIDIWRVVTEHYLGYGRNDVIDIGLPDNPEISETIVRSLMRGEIARVEDMKTLNDFKLLQIGWVYDLNFPRAFDIVRHRKYLEKIGGVLPPTDTVSQTVSAALRYCEKNFADERSVCRCQTP